MSTHIHTGTAGTLLRPAVWSNIFFIAPLALSVYFENLVLSVLIALVFTTSTLYHFASDKGAGFLLNADRAFAGILVLFDAGLTAFGEFTPPYFFITLILVPFTLYFYRLQNTAWHARQFTRYEWYHALWHAGSASITIFSILTFYL